MPAPARTVAAALFRLAFAAALCVLGPRVDGQGTSAGRSESTSVPAGARHEGDLVSLGRPVTVEGETSGSVVAVSAPVRISGRVPGDLVVFFGDAVLTGRGRVDGDVLVIGGELRAEGTGLEGRVGGRRLTLAALEAAFAAELETSPVSGRAVSPLLVAFRLFLLVLWLAVALALLRVRPRRVAAAADDLGRNLLAATVVGLATVLTGLLLAAGLLLLLPQPGALLAAGALLAFLAGSKAFGLAAVFLVVGRALTPRARRGSAFFGDPAAVAVGLLGLGLLSLLPAAGPLIWGVASLVAIGLSMRTAFGRPETLPAI